MKNKIIHAILTFTILFITALGIVTTVKFILGACGCTNLDRFDFLIAIIIYKSTNSILKKL